MWISSTHLDKLGTQVRVLDVRLGRHKERRAAHEVVQPAEPKCVRVDAAGTRAGKGSGWVGSCRAGCGSMLDHGYKSMAAGSAARMLVPAQEQEKLGNVLDEPFREGSELGRSGLRERRAVRAG